MSTAPLLLKPAADSVGKLRMRLLLVEDDRVDRLACRRALLQHPGFDFELLEAETGRQGLQMARDDKPNCILLDYHLPDMNGLEFLAELAGERGMLPVPVLKLTGSDNVGLAVEAMKRGARDYLIKDSEGRYLELLPAVVERVLKEQRMIEEKIEAEAKYRTLVESIPAITYILTLEEEGGPVFVSPQIERLGFTAEQWLADHHLRFRQIHAEDQALVWDAFQNSRETGEPLRCDYRMLDHTGEPVWFHDEASVVRDEAGKPLFLQGVMLDVTEKKAMEAELQEHRYRLDQQVAHRTQLLERRIAILEASNATLCGKLEQQEEMRGRIKERKLCYQTVLDALSHAVILVDVQQHVIEMNPAAEQLTGCQEADAAGKPVAEVLPPQAGEAAPPLAEALERICRTRVETVLEPVVLQCCDGQTRTFKARCIPICQHKGPLLGLALMICELP